MQLNDTIPCFPKISPCPTHPDSKLPRLTKRGAPIHRGGFFYGPIQRGIRLQKTGWKKRGILEDSAEGMLGGFEIKTDTDFEKDGGFFGGFGIETLIQDLKKWRFRHCLRCKNSGQLEPTGAMGHSLKCFWCSRPGQRLQKTNWKDPPCYENG